LAVEKRVAMHACSPLFSNSCILNVIIQKAATLILVGNKNHFDLETKGHT